MARNIFLFSDGTNNQGGNGRDTNVWRLYNMIAKDKTQLAVYDDGVGTQRSTLMKLAGLVGGWGLSKNIIDLYVYLACHYQEEDQIYLFGFSRGAFTMRLLANLIDFAGLPTGDNWKSKPEEVKRKAEQTLKRYKDTLGNLDSEYSANSIKGKRCWECNGNEFRRIEIRCIGVWDTVNATGAPVNEIRHWFPNWVQDESIAQLPQCVNNGFHALAIDESRKTFAPTLWDEDALTPDQKVEQVWFAGVHANIGGGYPKDGMARVSLQWMIEKIKGLPKLADDIPVAPIKLNNMAKSVSESADVHSRLYDSRAGLAALYRYEPRNPNQLVEEVSKGVHPKVHHSALDRIAEATHFYAPLRLSSFEMVKDKVTRSTSPVYHEVESKNEEGDRREIVERLIKYRVNLYWVFISLTAVMLLLPLAQFKFAWAQQSAEIWIISDVIRLLSGLLPGILSDGLEWYAKHPLWFLSGAGMFALARTAFKDDFEASLSDVSSEMWHKLNKAVLDQTMGRDTSVESTELEQSVNSEVKFAELGGLSRRILKIGSKSGT